MKISDFLLTGLFLVVVFAWGLGVTPDQIWISIFGHVGF